MGVATFPCLMSKLFTKFANVVAAGAGSLASACVLLLFLPGRLPARCSASRTPGSSSSTPPTTIITFLMVFLIQNTQNRDNGALQAKLDELIRAVVDADNKFIWH